jgi:hypothetical protein
MMRYGIIGVFGNRTHGKTTYMVYHLMRTLGTIYTKAYTNIHITGLPGVKYVKYEELKGLREPTIRGTPTAIIALDQIHRYLDARRSTSRKNVDVSGFIVESRQHGFDLIYTTWARSVVDPRLRRFTELTVLAQRVGPMENPKGFVYQRFDHEFGALPTQFMDRRTAEQVWQHFDTAELVPLSE